MVTFVNYVQGLEAGPNFIPGQSTSIQELNATVCEIAATNIPVLVVGESGTGKEVYARLIYRLSRLCHKPLTKLSCRAMEQGDFLAQLRSSLSADREQNADGARTLFLDGIDELGLDCQKGLLALWPDGEQERDDYSGVRLITSATRNIEKDIEAGRFRRELFFRINGVCLRLPTLRERKDDISLLLDYFLAKYAGQSKGAVPTLSKEDVELLAKHDWPGNIRELENFARKISSFGHVREAIEELHNGPKISTQVPGESERFSLKVVARTASRQAERELIREALERTHWNRKRAAQQLKISYKSLLYKIKQTGLVGQ
jgi:two-component system, NtrC family, response regulator AtoC